MRPISERAIHFKRLVQQHPLGTLVGLLGLAYTTFSAWRDEFASAKQQAALRAVNFLPHLSLGWWVAVSAIIFAIWMFEASFQSHRPGLRVTFDRKKPTAVQWDIDASGEKVSPMKMLVMVEVKNNADAKLDECRIQLEIDSPDQTFRPKGARYNVSKAFPLLLDETIPVPVLEFYFDVLDADMRVPQIGFKGGAWQQTGISASLAPGRHKVVVQAISSHSRIAETTLRLEYRGTNWFINGRSTGRHIRRSLFQPQRMRPNGAHDRE